MEDKYRKFEIDLPQYVDLTRKRELVDEIVEYVRNRTESGFNNRGQKFPKYSKDYIKSLDFRIGGKSPSKVDLTLSGDMLISMDWLQRESTRDRIAIGFMKSDRENAGKAEGNARGSYGKPRGNSSKARPFLGFVAQEREMLRAILNKYRKENG